MTAMADCEPPHSDVLRRALRDSIRISLGTALLASVATAAEPVQLPKVKVQADEPSYREPASPKLTSALADTPQTVSVIPEEIFNQQGAQNLTEVLRNTPGITFNAGENGFSTGLSNFSMREIGRAHV